MAHFAELDENNLVKRVLVVDNEVIVKDGSEDEEVGIKFLQGLFGDSTSWKQTSYNNNFRKNYAGKGYTYDETRDAFIAPKPYSSWLLDEDTCKWETPVSEPDDDKRYYWDEDTINWVEVPE